MTNFTNFHAVNCKQQLLKRSFSGPQIFPKDFGFLNDYEANSLYFLHPFSIESIPCPQSSASYHVVLKVLEKTVWMMYDMYTKSNMFNVMCSEVLKNPNEPTKYLKRYPWTHIYFRTKKTSSKNFYTLNNVEERAWKDVWMMYDICK